MRDGQRSRSESGRRRKHRLARWARVVALLVVGVTGFATAALALPGGLRSALDDPISAPSSSATAPAATHLAVAADSPQTAGAPFEITVSALDASDNPVAGYSGTVSFTSSDDEAALPGPYTFTGGENGVQKFTVTLSSAGQQTITATDATGDVTGTTDPPVTVEAAPTTSDAAPVAFAAAPALVDAAHSTVSAEPTTVVADGSSTATITVTLRDAADAVVAGRHVALDQGDGSSTISPASEGSDTTNADGRATFSVTDTILETVTYAATDDTDGVTLSKTADVGFVAGDVSAGDSTVSAFPANVPANGDSTSTIEVFLSDAYGHGVAGKDVALSADGGSSTISPASATTDEFGSATFFVSDTVPEHVTYSAADTTDKLAIEQTATVIFGAVAARPSAADLVQAIAHVGEPDGGFVAQPPDNAPNAVSTAPLAGFPVDGSSYAILTSGDAGIAGDTGAQGGSGYDDGGGNVRGNSDYDVTILRGDFTVPEGANCLTFNFRFLSQEFPVYVGSSFNDAFIAELDTSTWTTDGATISAPRNFAFDPTGDVISINSSGVTSMSAANAAGTGYGGATPELIASTPVTPGAHSVYFSIFDQGDNVLDSAVFLDNLRFGTKGAGECTAGAKPILSTSKTADSSSAVAGSGDGYTITVRNDGGQAALLTSITDTLPPGFSYVAGSTTGVTTADPTVNGSALTWPLGGADVSVPGGGSVSLHFGVKVASVAGTYSNNAGATASGSAVAPTGDTAPVTVTAASGGGGETAPALEVTVDVTPETPIVGGAVTFAYHITNRGNATANDVIFTLSTPPLNSTLVSVTAAPVSPPSLASRRALAATFSPECTPIGSDVTCSLGALAPGGGSVVTMIVTPTAAGPLSATASVSSLETSVAPLTTSVAVTSGAAGGGGGGTSSGGGSTTATTTAGGTATIASATTPSGTPPAPPPPTQPGEVSAIGRCAVVNGQLVPDGQVITLRTGDLVDVTSGEITLTNFSGGTSTFSAAQPTSGGQGGPSAPCVPGPPPPGKPLSAFRLDQSTAPGIPTIITLIGGDFTVCGATRSAASASAPKKVVRQLWGSAKGQFRTTARYSSATVRGTVWLTQDRCDGSLVRVVEDIVDVFDFSLKKTIAVGPGQSYLALPKRQISAVKPKKAAPKTHTKPKAKAKATAKK